MHIANHNPPSVTIGSLEGDGIVDVGLRLLEVGSNNLDTSFSGTIEDATYSDSLRKIGTGTLSLLSSSNRSGGTIVADGGLQALHDNALGAGAVKLVATGTTLTLQNGANNDYIYDRATLSLVADSTVNLNFFGTDSIYALIIDGIGTDPGHLWKRCE